MQLPVFVVDAFTVESFRGNPAAVCLLENELDEETHQKIAREMNLSETAFIRKLHPTDNFTQSSCFGLRWFTPATEVPLCGHATLASSAVLFHKIKNVNKSITFLTLSGELKARQADEGIVMDLPLYPTYPKAHEEVQDLIQVLGTVRVQDIHYSPDTRKLLVRLDDSYGRTEAPATPQGLSQGETSPDSYWSQQLGKKEMRAFQCSCRGGEMKISLRDGGRVDITGQTALVLEGNLTI
uniref:Phenazine biosynthesis like protein domain containing n=1 Tax=Monodelphis domestica TaxID=13616 RepID=A0A5F8GTZ4_MONDO